MPDRKTKIRIEAEDAASAIFDKVIGKANDSFKALGQGVAVYEKLSAAINVLNTHMVGTGTASQGMADGIGRASSGARELTGEVANLIGGLKNSWDLLGKLKEQFPTAFTKTTGVVGGVATALAIAGTAVAKQVENHYLAQAEEGKQPLPGMLRLSREAARERATEALGPWEAAKVFGRAQQFSAFGPDAVADSINWQVDQAIRTRGEEAIKEQARHTAERLSMELLGRLTIPGYRADYLKGIGDPKKRGEAEERFRLNDELGRNPNIRVPQNYIEDAIRQAGERAKAEHDAKVKSEREGAANQAGADLKRRADEIRQKVMTTAEHKKSEQMDLFGMLMGGYVGEIDFVKAMEQVEDRYKKKPGDSRLRPHRLTEASQPGYQDLYSHSLTRAPGNISPEIAAQQTRRQTLDEIRAQRREAYQHHQQALRELQLLRQNQPKLSAQGL